MHACTYLCTPIDLQVIQTTVLKSTVLPRHKYCGKYSTKYDDVETIATLYLTVNYPSKLRENQDVGTWICGTHSSALGDFLRGRPQLVDKSGFVGSPGIPKERHQNRYT